MSYKMKILAFPVVVSVLATAVAACGGGTLGGLPAGNLRVVNGISDSTSLDAKAPNLPSDINNILVDSASGFRVVPDSSFNLNLTVNTASGSQPKFNFNNVTIDRDTDTTIYFPGTIAAGTYATDGFQVDNVNATIPTGQVELQPVHASPASPAAISLYITDPAVASISGLTPITLNYRQAATPITLAGGRYRIRVTAAGSALVMFDSGSTGVNFAAGSRLQLAALDETETNSFSPLFILAIPSDGSGQLAIRNAP